MEDEMSCEGKAQYYYLPTLYPRLPLHTFCVLALARLSSGTGSIAFSWIYLSHEAF